MSDSVRPHKTAAHQAPPALGFSRQKHWSELPFPSPMQASENEVVQSSLTLSDPMNCSLSGSTAHGIFQARVLEWVPLPYPSRERQTLVNDEEIENGTKKKHLILLAKRRELIQKPEFKKLLLNPER